jgi:nitrite reductase/ring-hydroxylating ferredoxin subunit
MSEQQKKLDGPDFAQGLALADIAEDGMILGHVAGDAVLLARRGQELFAIGAECTHYHGPLAEGVLVEDTVRCPWHHACFSLRTGEALRAPALNPLPCWRVELQNGTVYVREKVEATGRRARTTLQPEPEAIVIVGGGGAGEAARLTRPWIASRCWSGSMSGAPPQDTTKCSPFGVIAPFIRWCGVRAP